MSSSWKRFWLELFTSKSWDYGRSIGRFIFVLVFGNSAAFFALLYRYIYKDDDLSRAVGFMKIMVSIDLIALIGFLLLIIFSLFKENRVKDFFNLLSGTFKKKR